MADMQMSVEEREAFLGGVHVGILSIERRTRGPLALPIWYQYEDGDVVMGMGGDSLKAKLLRTSGRATLTVQTETPPYQYAMVSGPVTLHQEQRDDLSMATRYLGPELGEWYAKSNPSTAAAIVARLHPEQWITCDYNKMPR